MILHLVTDEKFTDYAIQQFSAPEMESEFVLIPCNYSVGCDVKYKDYCRVIRTDTPEFEQLLENLGNYSAIVMHGMFWYEKWQKRIIDNIPESVKLGWVFWGGEIYSRKEVEKHSLAPYTRIMKELHDLLKNSSECNSVSCVPISAYQRINYCFTDELEEYQFAKHFTESNFQYLPYVYYTLEETIGKNLMTKQCHGEGIWLCNSAALENNPFDGLYWLSLPWNKRLLRSRTLIISLSYGSAWIRNLMVKLSAIIFGKQVLPLTSYLLLKEYNELMLSCNTMILPYYTPAAQGNIITALWLGMRVYLSERSLSYHYFKRLGCHIFSIEHELVRSNKNRFSSLTQEEIDENRRILTKYYSKAVMDVNCRNIVDVLK